MTYVLYTLVATWVFFVIALAAIYFSSSRDLDTDNFHSRGNPESTS